jgi:hypothetical protein
MPGNIRKYQKISGKYQSISGNIKGNTLKYQEIPVNFRKY